MRRTLALAWLAFWVLGTAYATERDFVESTLAFEAVFFSAGQFGESWNLKYDGGEKVEIEINYLMPRSGKLKGEFVLTDTTAAEIREAAEKQRFFDLPGMVSSDTVPLHSPTLSLRISVGDEAHHVNLYDPKSLETSREAARFFSAWNAVFSTIPFKPSWQ